MVFSLVFFASAAFAQFTDIEPDTWPRVFMMENGETIVGFVDKENWEDEIMIVVERDEPWISGPKTKSILYEQIKEHNRELGSEWRERHQAAWESHGFQDLGTGREHYYVKSNEVKLARRARELAGIETVAAESAPGEAETETSGAAPPESVVAPTPGFFQQWGIHIAVAFVGIGLAAATVKFLLLD